jgi:hypothetical protein
VTDEQLFRHSMGVKIQNVCLNLTPAEREIIISGICGECYDQMFQDISDPDRLPRSVFQSNRPADGKYIPKTLTMDKYSIIKRVGKVYNIIDNTPKESWKNEVCTVYSATSTLSPQEIADALNMVAEMSRFSVKTSKKLWIETFRKFNNQ